MTGAWAARYGGAMVRVSGPGRLLVVLAAAMAVVLVAPMATLGRAASPDTMRPTATANTPFTLDLSASGDFVAQTNFVQCVGASMQMMLNMIRLEDDRTAGTQLELQDLARRSADSDPTAPSAKVRACVAGRPASISSAPARTRL